MQTSKRRPHSDGKEKDGKGSAFRRHANADYKTHQPSLRKRKPRLGARIQGSNPPPTNVDDRTGTSKKETGDVSALKRSHSRQSGGGPSAKEGLGKQRERTHGGQYEGV